MSPEIVVNGRFLSRRVTGVERYGRQVLSLIGDRCRVETTRSQGLRGHAWEQLILPRKLNPHSVLWSPANTGPLMIRRQALTLHDLSPLEHPHWFQRSFAVWYRLFLPILVKHVQVLFTPSEYTKEKVVRRFGLKNVIVTPNGVETSVFHPDAKQSQYALPPAYILFVGTLEPRKNLTGLLDAWNRIKDDFPEIWLVIAGIPGRVHRFFQIPKHMERVLVLGYVEENALPGLYAGAVFFVLPSFEEGFGLPALEAMACGAPVLVSNGGALPEVVGEAGVIFNLSQNEALAASMRRYLQEAEFRCQMKERGLARAQIFSWERPAKLIWDALYEI